MATSGLVIKAGQPLLGSLGTPCPSTGGGGPAYSPCSPDQGVCHTDLECLYETKQGVKFRPFPRVLCHEAAGIVESVGKGMKSFPFSYLNVETVDGINAGRIGHKQLADDRRISHQRRQICQFLGITFSQYAVVHDTSLEKIRSDAPLDKVCLPGCGVSTGCGAALNTAKSAASDSTRDAWSTCVIAGWSETDAMSVLVEKILMGRTLKGTYFGGWKRVDDYVLLDEFITHNLQLDQVNEAFDRRQSGKSHHVKPYVAAL